MTITETHAFKNGYKALDASYFPVMQSQDTKIPFVVELIFICSLLVRLVIASGLGAGFDEAYYYVYSLYPSLSYYDHPPLVAWLVGVFPFITGVVSPLTIRLGAVLLFSLSGLLFYKLATDFVGSRSAVLAYAAFNIIPLFMIGAGVMILPDAGLVFFWIAAILCVRAILKGPERAQLWLLGGILTGLAMLGKYHGILLALGFCSYVVLFRRDAIRRIGFILFVIGALVAFSPVLIWNARNGFASFLFQGGRAASSTFSLVTFIQGVTGQMALLTPMVMIPYWCIMWQTIRRGMIQGEDNHRQYFWFGTVPVLLFNVVSFARPILPHWTLPGYVILTIALGDCIARRMENKAWVRWYAGTSAIVILTVLAFAYGHVRWGIFRLDDMAAKGWISHKDARLDPTLDVHGWEEARIYLKTRGVDPHSTFLFSYKWFIAGELAMATGGEFPVLCFNDKDPRGFGVWNTKHQTVGKDGIFVCTNRYRRDPVRLYGEFFETINAPDSVVVYRGSSPAKTMYFYRCRNLLKEYMVKSYRYPDG